MSIFTINMLEQSDVRGRLRLFRWGLLTTSIVTFAVSLIYPQFALRKFGGLQAEELPPITEYLTTALSIAVAVTLVLVVIYFIYAEILKTTVGKWQSVQQ